MSSQLDSQTEENIIFDFGISAAELKRLCEEIEDASEPPSKKPRKDTLNKVSTMEEQTSPRPSGIRPEKFKKSLNCPLCELKFQRKNHLLRHMRWHENNAESSSRSSMETSEDEAQCVVRTVEGQPQAMQSSVNEVDPERTTTKDRSELTGASTHVKILTFGMAEANPIVTGENVLMSLGLWQVNGMPEGAHNLYTWLEEDTETSTMSVTDEVADNVFQDTTMPIACSSGINGASQVHVEIIEEPEDGIKFRYEKEERLSGRIKGANSTANHKTYPTIKVHGYRGPACVVVSLIAVRPPYYPHPHRLEGESCGSGVCYKTIDNPEMKCSFSDLRMHCVKRQDVEKSLAEREALQVDPFGTGFSHSSKSKKINYNAVRLCFQVFLPDSNGKFSLPVAPVISTPVGNKSVSDLVITKLSHCSAPVSGGQDVILLCGQVKKDDIEIVFHEENEKGVIWSANGEFSSGDVHRKVAISFKTPAYKNPNIRKNVECFISLRRKSDGIMSKPRHFTLFPSRADPEGMALKHSKFEDLRLRRILQIDDLCSQNSDPEGAALKHSKFEAFRVPRILQIDDLCSQNSGAANLLHPSCVNETEFDVHASRRSVLKRVIKNESTPSPYSKNPASTVNVETTNVLPFTHHTIDGKSADEQMSCQENVRLLQDDGALVPAVNTLINSSDIDFNSKDLDGNLSGMTIDSLSEAVGLISTGLMDGKTSDEQMTPQDNVISVLFEDSGNGA